MLKPIRLIAVFGLFVAIGFLTAGGCFDGDMQKYTFGGTIPSAGVDGGMVVAMGDEDGGGLDKANFGGNVNACECGDLDIWDILSGGWFDKCVESNILYHDKPAGIMLKAKATDVEDCTEWYSCWGRHPSVCCVCDDLAEELCDGEYPPQFMIAAKIKYRIQGPLDGDDYDHKWIKDGGVICATDNGEGFPGGNADDPDFVAIKLLKGPSGYKYYANCGPVSGNVQEHECDYYEDLVW